MIDRHKARRHLHRMVGLGGLAATILGLAALGLRGLRSVDMAYATYAPANRARDVWIEGFSDRGWVGLTVHGNESDTFLPPGAERTPELHLHTFSYAVNAAGTSPIAKGRLSTPKSGVRFVTPLLIFLNERETARGSAVATIPAPDRSRVTLWSWQLLVAVPVYVLCLLLLATLVAMRWRGRGRKDIKGSFAIVTTHGGVISGTDQRRDG